MKQNDFSGLSLDKNDFIMTSKQEIEDAHIEKEEEKKERRKRKYYGENSDEETEGDLESRCLILAIPSNHHFESLCCSKSPKQCLRYLVDEIDFTSPKFKAYLKELFNNFTFKEFRSLQSNYSNKLIDCIIRAKDVEYVLLYIDKILARKLNFSDEMHGIPDKNEVKIAEMLKSVPWIKIKGAVINVIENVGLRQYKRWMDVFNHSGIIDIASKVIDLSFQKIRSCNGGKASDPSLWEKIFQSVHDHKELSTRWEEDILKCQHFKSSLGLLSALCDKILFEKPSEFSKVFESFIERVKEKVKRKVSSRLRDSTPERIYYCHKDGSAPLITSVLKHTLHDYLLFWKHWQTLFDFLFSKEHFSFGLSVLRGLSKENESYTQSNGFKFIFNVYFYDLFVNSSVHKYINEKAIFGEIILRGNVSDLDSNVTKYVRLCRTLDPDSIYKIIFKILELSKENKGLKCVPMVNGLVDIVVNLFTTQSESETLFPELAIKLFSAGHSFDSKLDELLSNFDFTNEIKKWVKNFIYEIRFKEDIPETETFKKLIKCILKSIQEVLAGGNREPFLDEYYVVHFIQNLYKTGYYKDLVLDFISCDQFHINGEQYYAAHKKESYIESMILEYKENLSKNDFYAELMYVHLKSLKSLQDKGCPKFTW